MNANAFKSIGIENLHFEANDRGFVLRYFDPNANQIGKGIINVWKRGIDTTRNTRNWDRGFGMMVNLYGELSKEEKT